VKPARNAWPIAGLAVLLVLTVAVALLTGNGELAWPAAAGDWRVITELRLPRVVAGLSVGVLLALAGMLMQVLLRNPLADPYVLGVSGGAATFALATMSFGLSHVPVPLAAFCGALLSSVIVFVIARGDGPWSTARMLLTGVVLAAGWGALISLLLSLGDDASVKGMLFWLMGDLGYARVSALWLLPLASLVGLLLLRARSLNILAAGPIEAALLGEAPRRRQIEIYVAASAMTAIAVSIAGTIGFVGLIVPHLCRMLVGGDHRRLLPATALFGASFLVLADTLARNLFVPRQMPVGVLTALLGVPIFLLLLRRARS